RDKAGRIDDHPADVKLRLEQIRKHLAAGKIAMIPHRDVKADRTREFAVEIKAEQPGILGVVVGVAECAGEIRTDRSLAQISLVAQPENDVALVRGLGRPTIDTIEELGDAVRKSQIRGERDRRKRYRHHGLPPRWPIGPDGEVNSSLTQAQLSRWINLN